MSDIFENDRIGPEHKQRPTKLASNNRRPPNLSEFSIELNLLTVGYRARSVRLRDLSDHSYIDRLRRTSNEFQLAVVALVSNPIHMHALSPLFTRTVPF